MPSGVVPLGDHAPVAPHDQRRALDLARAAIGLVLLEVDAHRGAIVLAHGVNRRGVARVLQKIFIGLEIRGTLAVAEQEADGIGADHSLGQRMCLGEKEPVPITHAEAPVGAPQRVAGGHDVEHREFAHRGR